MGYWNQPKEFTVTEDHVKLLQNAYVGWNDCESGAPSMDPKRPYGNSDVVGDIAEILGIKPNDEDDHERFSDSDESMMLRLHEETGIVLQIVLRTGHLKPGKYRQTKEYGVAWEEIP